ncbi:hypothetical protein [Magnetospirillum sp. 64-120]|uniref:hypothetical protein n=1 Tax=Magnetospirillum sp. 64-120 TaxID=1895778 RepID=UPI000926ED7E|nr:hypothetical protein [Magnetospirillum sp. 64-120]OJX79331.1 MAG: hypothetical protein BGO92_12640 [Magnetospirillum sp. 64-120]
MFTKFLLTVAVVAVIWFGFRAIQRRAERRDQAVRPPTGAGKRFTPEMDGDSVRDLVKCPICNTWRPAGAASCGRSECPN